MRVSRSPRRCEGQTKASAVRRAVSPQRTYATDAPQEACSPCPRRLRNCAWRPGHPSVAGRSPTCSLQRLGPSGPNVHRALEGSFKECGWKRGRGAHWPPQKFNARTLDQILDTGWPSHGSTIAHGELPLVTTSVGFLNLVSLVRFQPGAPESPCSGRFPFVRLAHETSESAELPTFCRRDRR